MGARDCFCGCGRKVKLRHVPYNRLGVELHQEVQEWAALRDAFQKNEMDFGLEEFFQVGQEAEAGLRDYMHSGEKPDSLDLTTAGRWNQFSRKERRKFDKRLNETAAEAMQELEDTTQEFQGFGGYEHIDRDSDDGGLDYAGALRPSVMLEHLPAQMEQPIDEDLEALLVAYLQESFEDVLPNMRQSTVDLLINIAWAGYCARSIATDTVEEAREDSPLTRSLLEWNHEQSDDDEPMFLLAARLAGGSAGLEEVRADELATRASWIAIPGATVSSGEGVDAAVEPLEQLSFVGSTYVVGLFSDDEGQVAQTDGVTDAIAKSVWLFGYFLRVQEQYSPIPNLFAGARAYIYGESPK